MSKIKMTMLGIMGAGLLAIPLAMPSTAQADDLKISLNLGGGSPVYYSQPQVQRVVYREPVRQRVIYREAPRRVVVVQRPQRIVYVDKHHGRGHGNGHGRWDDRGQRVAWR